MKRYVVLAFFLLLLLIGFIGILQTATYKKDLQPTLSSEAEKILKGYGVTDGKVTFNWLHARVEGFCSSDREREEISEEIRNLAGGAVRLLPHDNALQVYGKIDISKEGEMLTVSGYSSSAEKAVRELQKLAPHLPGNMEVQKGRHLKEDDVYIDSAPFYTPGISEWVTEYLSIPGERSFSISAPDNVLTLHGELTEKLKNKVMTSAAEIGLKAVSELKIKDPIPAELLIKRKGGETEVKGQLAEDYDLTLLSSVFDTSKILLDPFTEGPEELSSAGFQRFLVDYFQVPGDRTLTLIGNKVSLRGTGTQLLKRTWFTSLRELGLEAEEKLNLFPSVYHFPDYEVTSIIESETLENLKKVFMGTEIYFPSGSSKITEEERPKLDLIAQTVMSLGEEVTYVIGGHTDATGNLDGNLKLSASRAHAVVSALELRGVPREYFTVVPFGATEASVETASERDRRVEILIK